MDSARSEVETTLPCIDLYRISECCKGSQTRRNAPEASEISSGFIFVPFVDSSSLAHRLPRRTALVGCRPWWVMSRDGLRHHPAQQVVVGPLLPLQILCEGKRVMISKVRASYSAVDRLAMSASFARITSSGRRWPRPADITTTFPAPSTSSRLPCATKACSRRVAADRTSRSLR